ncbi:hypothetical protein ACXR0O_11840 [Verrucomicrobiota bacterium sgz303538]
MECAALNEASEGEGGGWYTGALKLVLRRVHEGDLERLSSSVLTAELVEKFSASYVREARDEDFLERDKRIRGANLVDRDHADFLRRWVEGHAKVSYELRGWAATVVAQRQGEEFAERFLRHKTKTVAGKHYITQQSPPAPITLGDCCIEPFDSGKPGVSGS